MRCRRGVACWGKHIEAWRGSGLSQVAYCATQDLGIHAFRAQIYAQRARSHSATLSLVPVVIDGGEAGVSQSNALRPCSGAAVLSRHSAPAPTGGPRHETASEGVSLRVCGAGDWRIECGTLPSATWVAELMKALS